MFWVPYNGPMWSLKNLFFFLFKNRVWFGVSPPPPPSVWWITTLFTWFFLWNLPLSLPVAWVANWQNDKILPCILAWSRSVWILHPRSQSLQMPCFWTWPSTLNAGFTWISAAPPRSRPVVHTWTVQQAWWSGDIRSQDVLQFQTCVESRAAGVLEVGW